MTFFGDVSNLVALEDKSTYVGCSEDKSKGNVIFTFTDCLLVYNIENKRTISLWKPKRGEVFSVPAVYCENLNEYVAVVNCKVIKTFKEDYNKAKKFTVNSYIHRVLYHSPSGKTFLVFEDLTVLPMEEVLEEPESSHVFAEKTVLSSHLSSNTLYIMSMKNETAVLTSYDLDANKLRSMRVVNEDKKLLGSCFSLEGRLITMWSNGSVCKSCEVDAQCDELSWEEIVTLPTHQSVSSYGLRMKCLSKDMVAVLHYSSSSRANDKSDGVCVSAVDLIYNSVLTCDKSLTCDLDAKIEVHEGHLLMFADRNLVELGYQDQPITLSTVAHFQRASNIQHSDLNTDAFYQRANIEERKLMDALVNGKEGVEGMSLLWDEFYASLSEWRQVELFESLFMHKLVELLAQNCSDQAPLLLTLLATEHLTTRVAPSLLDCIVKLEGCCDEKLSLLSGYLHHVPDITEQHMVASLDALLTTTTSSDEKSKEAEKLIEKIIGLTNTESEVIDALTKLNYKKSETLLNLLCDRLASCKVMDGDESSYKHIISWLSCLIDVNFANFIAYHDSLPTLLNLQGVVNLQSEYFDEWRKVEILLMMMESSVDKMKTMKKMSNSSRHDFSYKVQLMKI